MKIEHTRAIGFFNADVPYTRIQSSDEPSHTVVVVLPGQGYTVKSPALYYTTQLALQKQWDVIHVNYNYNQDIYANFSLEDMIEVVQTDTLAVLHDVGERQIYKQFYIVGKSLGTIGLSAPLHREYFRNVKKVWLTPLLQLNVVYEAMLQSTASSLCLIGSEDHCYIQERYDVLQKSKTMNCELIEGVNHGFDHGTDAFKSIQAIQHVIEETELFFNQ